jgi:hypothetical protein
VRRSDARWAVERPLEEVIAAHLWRYSACVSRRVTYEPTQNQTSSL